MVAGASPDLVSSLLIRSDQVRRSMFGFRSARSTLAAQGSALRFVVQLSYRPSSPRCALLRFHHQVSGPGLIPAVLARKRTRGLGIAFLAHRSHIWLLARFRHLLPLFHLLRVLSTPPLT